MNTTVLKWRIKRIVQSKLATRWHMAGILFVTFLCGIIFNKLFYLLGLEHLLLRHTAVLLAP